MSPQKSDELAKLIEKINQQLKIDDEEYEETDIVIGSDDMFEIHEFIESKDWPMDGDLDLDSGEEE